jgi:hypothetical protein
MRVASTSICGIRPGIRRRTVARMASVLALVAGAAMINVSPAGALPRACDTIGHRADLYFGYAQVRRGRPGGRRPLDEGVLRADRIARRLRLLTATNSGPHERFHQALTYCGGARQASPSTG